MSKPIPSKARAVIIGGGVSGEGTQVWSTVIADCDLR